MFIIPSDNIFAENRFPLPWWVYAIIFILPTVLISVALAACIWYL